MPADLHLDPAALRVAAHAITALLPALDVRELDPVDLRVLADLPGGDTVLAGHDRLVAAVGRAHRELADLAAGLGAVVNGLDAVEQGAVRTMAAVGRWWLPR